jgi:hypothetical protein
MTQSAPLPTGRRRGTRRSVVVAAATALLLVLAAGAAAYWTSNGSGTGSATTAASAQALVVNQTSTLSGLAPGVAPKAIAGNFDNPNDAPTYVNAVTVGIASVTKDAGAPAGTCDSTDYTLANATMTVNSAVAAGTGKGAFSGATIQFNSKAGVNQDACKGATVSLAYTIS